MSQATMSTAPDGVTKYILCDNACLAFCMNGSVEEGSALQAVLGTMESVDIVSVLYSRTGSEIAYHIGGEYGLVNTTKTASEAMRILGGMLDTRLIATRSGKVGSYTYTQVLYIFNGGKLTKNLLGDVL